MTDSPTPRWPGRLGQLPRRRANRRLERADLPQLPEQLPGPDPRPRPAGRVSIEVGQDGLTGGLQVALVWDGPEGPVSGYRLAGAKYSGRSRLLLREDLDQRDAEAIARALGWLPQVDLDGVRSALHDAYIDAWAARRPVQ